MDSGRLRRACTREGGSARSGPTRVRGLDVLSIEGITNKPHPQGFYPTCRGFHPLGGLPGHLFTGISQNAQQKGVRREFTRRTPVGHRTARVRHRAKDIARSRTSCPVSAASAASAPAAAAARRTATARGVTAAARMSPGVTTGVTTGVTAAATAGGATAAVTARPPAAARGAATARAPARAPSARLLPAPGPLHERDDQSDHRRRDHHSDKSPHRPHVLPFPRSEVPRFRRLLGPLLA